MKVWNEIRNFILSAATVYLVLSIIWTVIPYGRDSTDGDRRSGLALRIDALTGCHYLEGSRGGLIPRVTANGEHICSGPEN